MITAIVFFAILGLLVLVHELGHFVVARRNGIPVEEFGFGFPPRLAGTYRDSEGKRRWVFGNREVAKEIGEREETVYSLNVIPLGGFVRIKGEDGEFKDDPRSFSAQKVWTRFKVLSAGVLMNVLLSVVLFSLAFWIGLPEQIDEAAEIAGAKVQISMVKKDSPAEKGGLQLGDEVLSIVSWQKTHEIRSTEDIQNAVGENSGRELVFNVIHPGSDDPVALRITPRVEAPQGEGLVGIEIVRTANVKHGLLESIWLGLKTTLLMIVKIFVFLGDLISRLWGGKEIDATVAGPVGIAVLTGQMTRVGLAFILQFAAVLSVNLAVINFLPIPALDGGRVLFLAIEKIKGAPVAQRVEGMLHTIGFALLIGLMILVTVRDLINFEVFEKIRVLF